MNKFIVKKTISINAEPSEVWDALTQPEKTKKYFFHCEVFSNWKIGSTITFRGKIFLIKKIEMSGRILQIEKQKLLQYTLRNGKPGKYPDTTFSTVTDELTYQNGKTLVTITDDVGEGEGASERYEKSMKGWDKVLKGLKKLVENSNA